MSAADRECFAGFAELMAPSVRRAASLARELEGRVANLPKLDEPTRAKQALTEADERTQEVLLDALSSHFPDTCLEAEEDTPGVARFRTGRDPLVVIDPIDGTLYSYLEAQGPYAVMIGAAVHRRFDAALIALPREGLLCGATRGRGAWTARGDARPRAVRATADGDRVFVSHSIPKAAIDVLEGCGLEVIRACGGAIAIAPLVAGVRAGLRHATNPGGLSLRGRIGCLIAREAGARLATDGGRDFPEDLDTAARTLRVAASDADLEMLAEALAAAGLD